MVPGGRLPDDITCIRCLETKPREELDRLLWCDECLHLARRRASAKGRLVGILFALGVALYVGLWIRPDYSLIPTAWIAVLAVAYIIGIRMAREFIFGWARLRNRRAVEATPPAAQTEPEDGAGAGHVWE